MRCFSNICLAILLLLGCQSTTLDPDADQEKTTLDRPKTEHVYTPPSGYQASSVDPLAALYGGQIGKKADSKISKASLLKDFQSLKDSTLQSPFPRRWQKAFKKLNRQIPTKVTKWSASIRTRMERGQRDQELSVRFSILGQKSKLRRIPLSIFKSIPALKSFPQHLGDQHEHIAKSKNQELRLTYEGVVTSEPSDDPTVLAEVTIHWLKTTSSSMNEDPKNCRYVHALEAGMGAKYVSWAAQHFKSTSTRRFVEWSVEQRVDQRSWRGTWLYRNGSYRDKAVGWWVKKLTAQKAKQISEEGMEQQWQLKSGLNIHWWPETDPGPMGCQLAGPLLSIEGVGSL